MLFPIYPKHALDLSLTAQLFYDTLHFRDKQIEKGSGLLFRVSMEVAFGALLVASLIQATILFPLALVGKMFGSDAFGFKYVDCVNTFLYSGLALALNFSKSNLAQSIVESFPKDSNLKDSYLVQAISIGNYGIAKQALEMGADPHKKKGKADFTPAQLAHVLHHPKLLPLFPLTEEEADELDVTMLSHWLNLTGHTEIDGKKIQLEGSSTEWMCVSYAEALRKFNRTDEADLLTLSNGKMHILQQAFLDAAEERNLDKRVEKIRNKELVYLNAGWKTHGITLAFCNDYLAICNRGSGSKENGTLKVYRIDSSRITEEILEFILRMRTQPEEIADPYLYEKLPALLGPQGKPEQDSLCSHFNAIAPKQGQGGHCALNSKKSALRFGWAMLLSAKPLPDTLNQARKECKLFTNWAAFDKYQTISKKRVFTKLPASLTDQIFWTANRKGVRFRRLANQLEQNAVIA